MISVSAPSPGVIAGRDGIVARGAGRAYGDAAIGARVTLATTGLDRIRFFDPAIGRIRAEAGVTLEDILRWFVPRGFFPPVVPGTKAVTVGGMIAADVHGKNHHRERGFGAHVEALTLALADGRTADCSRDRLPDLFAATIGGMGLTGVILDATFRLRPVESGWIRRRTVAARDLKAAIASLDAARDATYAVAWIDTLARGPALGRALVFTGEHATRAEAEAAGLRPLFPRAKVARLSAPFDLPCWTLNRLSVGAFNEAYFRRGASRDGGADFAAWDSFFFPLDGVRGWNRIYGRGGFAQHQCVIPRATAEAALSEMLDRVAASGRASFLAVLKTLGPGGDGLLSFAMEGVTLALDLPVAEETLRLMDELDRVMLRAGGRLYLAKDARQSRETFEGGYPGLAAFREARRAAGAEGRVASRMSGRLGL